MNALCHGLAAVSINTITVSTDDRASPDDSCTDAMHQHLQQIEAERLKIFNEVGGFVWIRGPRHTPYGCSTAKRRSNATRSAPIQS
jgi:hypothetical protein